MINDFILLICDSFNGLNFLSMKIHLDIETCTNYYLCHVTKIFSDIRRHLHQ